MEEDIEHLCDAEILRLDASTNSFCDNSAIGMYEKQATSAAKANISQKTTLPLPCGRGSAGGNGLTRR